MNMMKIIGMILMCLGISGMICAAAGRSLAQVERELAEYQELLQVGLDPEDQRNVENLIAKLLAEQRVLQQVSKHPAPAASWEEAQVQLEEPQVEQLYFSEDESTQKLRENSFLSSYNAKDGVFDLPWRLQQLASGAQLIQLRSFRQATDLCGYASLANLYAINNLLKQRQSIKYMDVSTIAKRMIERIDALRLELVSSNPMFALRDEAGYEELATIAREIGFDPELFILAIFERASMIAQKTFDKVATVVFEGRPRGEGLPYYVPYSYSGAILENESAAFELIENKHERHESEEVVFADVISSLLNQQTTNFILNSNRGHYMAACVENRDGKYTIYYLNSTNAPIKNNDFNQINLILWVDHLIQLAQRSSYVPGLSVNIADAVADTEAFILAYANEIKGLSKFNRQIARKLLQEIKDMKLAADRDSERIQSRAQAILQELRALLGVR